MKIQIPPGMSTAIWTLAATEIADLDDPEQVRTAYGRAFAAYMKFITDLRDSPLQVNVSTDNASYRVFLLSFEEPGDNDEILAPSFEVLAPADD